MVRQRKTFTPLVMAARKPPLPVNDPIQATPPHPSPVPLFLPDVVILFGDR